MDVSAFVLDHKLPIIGVLIFLAGFSFANLLVAIRDFRRAKVSQVTRGER